MTNNGTTESAPRGMARLKELLFESEAQALAGLDQRLKSIEASSVQSAQERLEAGRRLELLFDRAGTEDRFQNSVATVLDRALREAEARNHDELAHALAPLVIKTIKVELKNSQDEMVDILYPLTGRMVQAYVKSAIRDLTRQINERLEQNPVMLRIRSLATGKPVAELAIAESQRLEVEEVFLIRRGSGELIARWPEVGRTSNADIHMSGVLAAVNEFAATAFAQEGGQFRSFEFDNLDVFVRASPAYILAARCSGIAPSGIDEIFDEEFLATLERVASVEKAAWETETGAEAARIEAAHLAPLADGVNQRTTAVYEENAKSGIGGALLKFAAFLILVPLLAWFFWGLYTNAEEALVRRSANAVLADARALAGYPTTLDIGYRGHTVTVTGLAPDAETRRSFVQALTQELPKAKIVDQLTVIPTTELDTAPLEQRVQRRLAALQRDMSAAASLRDIVRAERRLGEALAGLDRLGGDTGAARPPVRLTETREGLTTALSDVERLRARLTPSGDAAPAPDQLIAPLDRTAGRVAALFAGLAEEAPARSAPAYAGPSPTMVAAAERLASESERLATLVTALTKAARLIPPPLPVKPVVVPPPPTPEERLRAFTERRALFFSSGVTYKSTAAATRTLDEAAALIKAATGTQVRIVGYTDEKGGQEQNNSIAINRAQHVADDLVARGVPADRLIVVGRINGYFDVSPVIGAESPNRRVELEVAFVGERR